MEHPTLSESLHLKHTNVSQPSIQRTTSQQSLAASEDFYSASSGSGSTGSSARSNRGLAPPPLTLTKPHLNRYTTAPLQQPPSPSRVSYEGVATPIEVRQVETPRITPTPMRGIGRRRNQEGSASGEAQSTSSIKRKPVPSTVYEETPRSSVRYSTVPVESSAMRETLHTPELSDTPYIHFALDQLTNDADDRGERAPVDQVSKEVDEITPISPYNPDKYPLGSFPFEETAPLKSHPVLQRKSSSPPIPPRSERRSITVSPDGLSSPPPQYGLLVPFEPPSDSFLEPLTALPSILRPLRLVTFIALLALYTICLLFCAIWSRIRTGLCDYGSLGDGRYFLWQYLPTMIGMALLLWLFEIEGAAYRVAPFIALSSQSSASRGHAAFLPLSPSNFLLPTLTHLKAGQPIITIFLVVSWLNLLTIPLVASAFNVYFHSGRWVWIATQGVIWTVIVLYALLLVAAILLLLYLHKTPSGLKWDARNLADLATLIQASNALDSYANYPLITADDEVKERIIEREDRLGYFTNSTHPNQVIHTLGSPNRQQRKAGGENFRKSERYSTSYTDPESGRPFSEYSNVTHNTTDPVLPHEMATSWQSHIPWFMRTPLVILWINLAILILIAFLIASYLPSTRVRSGFSPDLSVLQDNFGFSATNFLYSFIPSLLGLLCLLVWQPFDFAFRRLQPYASLSTPGGEVAEKSLLLSYNADEPILITLKAAVNHHFRVALLSFITIIAAILPVLGGGVFWSQFSVAQQRVRVYAQMPAYYALTFFFTIYCLSYIFVLPGKLRRLPNQGRSLADVIALMHQSQILDDPEFRSPASETALMTRLIAPRPDISRRSIQDPEKALLGTSPATPGAAAIAGGPDSGSKISLSDSLRGITQARRSAQAESRLSGGSRAPLVQPRYGFGRYIGRDGREWLGIDKIGRPVGKGGEMVVRV